MADPGHALGHKGGGQDGYGQDSYDQQISHQKPVAGDKQDKLLQGYNNASGSASDHKALIIGQVDFIVWWCLVSHNRE